MHALSKVFIILATILTTTVNAYELEVGWPFSNHEDWAVGSAHSEQKFCLLGNCTLNALDFFTASSFKQWDKPKGKAPVHAVITGPIYKLDDCFMIQYSTDRKYRIKYYHMGNIAEKITRDGSLIEKGEFVGTYSNNKEQALCRGGMTTSPHVHISFFKKSNEGVYAPLNLTKIKIGNFLADIQTSKNYSHSCSEFNLISEQGDVKICPFNKVESAIEQSNQSILSQKNPKLSGV